MHQSQAVDYSTAIEKTLNSLAPIMFSNKLLGTYPFEVRDGKLVWSAKSAVYSLLMFVFSAYNLFYLSIYSDFIASETPKQISTRVYILYKIAQAVIFFLCFPVQLMCTAENNRRFLKLFDSNYKLASIGFPLEDAKIRTCLRNLNLKVYVAWSLAFLTDYVILFVWGDMAGLISVYSWTVGNVVIIYNSVQLFFLVGVLKYFTECFSKINAALKRVGKRGSAKATQRSITPRKQLSVSIEVFDTYVWLLESTIRQISPVFLLTVIANIVGTTGHLFNVITTTYGIIVGQRFDDLYIAVYSSYWSVIILFKMQVLISESVDLMKVFKKPAFIVHDLLLSDNTVGITDELEQFSMQLLHQKFELSIYGLFTFDYPLFGSMIGAISTFLVILVQFQIENGEP